MQITHDVENSRFVALGENGEEMGEIRYAAENGALNATHTLVPKEFGGRGIAAKLLDALAEHARAQKQKIIPVCSYVEKAFERAPEKYSDVK